MEVVAAFSLPQSKEVTMERVHQSIVDVLSLLTDSKEEQIAILVSLSNKIKASQVVEAAVDENVNNPGLRPLCIDTRLMIPYNEKGFATAYAAGVPYERENHAARQAKCAHCKEFSNAFEKIPTDEQKLVVLYTWLK